MTPRAAAARSIAEVLRGNSLSVALPNMLENVDPRDHGLVRELCYGTLRWYPAIELIMGQLLKTPLRNKEAEVKALLALGIYQLWQLNTADHAAVNETVSATAELNKQWARKLTNGVLRNYQRRRDQIEQQLGTNEQFATAHLQWLATQLHNDWPQQASTIFTANNQRPPMTLRVNCRHLSRDDYLQLLAENHIEAKPSTDSDVGITLRSGMDVGLLPGFGDGWVSVQDQSAQLCVPLLRLQPGQRVLDACCAPGGKTCHILESEPQLKQVLAVDLEASRMSRVEENLKRLGLNAQLQVADVSKVSQWWDGEPFDRILLDAPCSATGVIRRNPDIKLLRKPADIVKLATIQGQLLNALWPTLAPGGILLYATCSQLAAENSEVIESFLQRCNDAQLVPIDTSWGVDTGWGRQLFPGEGDGFFYARLQKASGNN